MLTHHTTSLPARCSCGSRSRVHSRRRMMFRCSAGSPTDGRWLRRDTYHNDHLSASYLYVNKVVCESDYLGLFSLNDINYELQGTFEFNSPVPVGGGFPFISVTLEKLSRAKTKVSISIGLLWGVGGLLKKFPPKISQRLDAFSIAFYFQRVGEYECDCLNLCELSENAALTLGDGRRGRDFSSSRFLNEPQSPWLFGIALEGQLAVNICTGTLEGKLSLVASVGLKREINIFGSKYEIAFDYDYVAERPLGSATYESLKYYTPCKK